MQNLEKLRRELFEKTREAKQLRQELVETRQELDGVRQELLKKVHDLSKLRKALPPLPDPERLHGNIVNRCYDFYACTKKMTQLESRIRALSRSTERWETRHNELSLLEITIDKLRFEFLFVRHQLRTWFAAPELLFATEALSPEIWSTWMAAPQLNDEGKPLLMDPHLLDTAIADQLMLLDDHRSTLNDLRCSILAESNQESSTFQEQVKTALVNMQSSLDAALQALAQRPQPPADKPVHNLPPEPDDNAPAHEDIPVQQQEGEVIHDNLEFMEQIDEDLDPQPEDEEPEHQVNDNAEPMEHVDGVEAEPQPNAPIRQQIEQELQQLRQAQNDFHLMIEELRNEPVCAPRRFGRGAIHQEDERFMRCAFCSAVGIHYSDKCTDVRLARERRSIIEDRKRCLECLEYCRGGKQCPKYYARCYYCGSYEHHSALCELPERSEEISEQLSRARASLADVENRIQRLEEDLQQLDD